MGTTNARAVFHLLDGEGRGATLATCADCSPALRKATQELYDDVREWRHDGAGWCIHCAWCGHGLHIPAVHGGRGKECTLHGAACPPVRPMLTVQGKVVSAVLRKLGLVLTKEGWFALSDEIEAAGRHGVPMPGVLITLIGDPSYVREIPTPRRSS